MTPTADFQGAAGQERVVVHADAEQAQAALAAQGVVDAPFDDPVAGEAADQQTGQQLPQLAQGPGGRAEEAVQAAVVAVAGPTTGEDQFGDEAVAEGQQPAAHQRHKGLEGRRREGGSELLQQGLERLGKIHGWPPVTERPRSRA